MNDSDDSNTFHQDRVKLNFGPKLTYSKLLALLAANKTKQTITVDAKQYDTMFGCDCTGECSCDTSNMPDTEIDGENPAESGHTFDGPNTDDDTIRRWKDRYKANG